MGSIGRDQTRGEVRQVTGMVLDAPTTNSLGQRQIAAGKVEVLLVFIGLDMDRSVEAKLVNIKKGDMGEGDGPGKSDRIETVEALEEKE